ADLPRALAARGPPPAALGLVAPRRHAAGADFGVGRRRLRLHRLPAAGRRATASLAARLRTAGERAEAVHAGPATGALADAHAARPFHIMDLPGAWRRSGPASPRRQRQSRQPLSLHPAG